MDPSQIRTIHLDGSPAEGFDLAIIDGVPTYTREAPLDPGIVYAPSGGAVVQLPGGVRFDQPVLVMERPRHPDDRVDALRDAAEALTIHQPPVPPPPVRRPHPGPLLPAMLMAASMGAAITDPPWGFRGIDHARPIASEAQLADGAKSWRRVEKRARKAAKLRGRIAPHGIEIEREPDGRYLASLEGASVYGRTRHAAIEDLRRVFAGYIAARGGIWPVMP